MERFRAYEGSKPYAFISYAHMDSDRVYEIISALNNDGFRIWYDQGIEIARRYKAVINEHIEKCSAFVVFATREGINRPEVIDECAYAIALRKKMIIVYLEDIPAGELDAALRATFAINQRVMWGELADWERKYKLREALVECGGEPKAQPVMVSVETAKAAPAAAAVMAAPTDPKAETVSSPLLDRGFVMDGKKWAKFFFCAALLLLPVLFFYEYVNKSLSGISMGIYQGYYSGVEDSISNSALIIMINSVDSISAGSDAGALKGKAFVVLLFFTLVKVLPFIYGFATKLDNAEKRKTYKYLNLFSIISVAAVWIASYVNFINWSMPSDADYNYYTVGVDDIIALCLCWLAMTMFGTLRDAAIIAAGNAAVSNCFGNKIVSIKTAVRSKKWGIAALIAVGIVFALFYSVEVGLYAGTESGIFTFFCVSISKLLSFPWLALLLMKFARDNAPETADLQKNKKIIRTVRTIAVTLIILAALILALYIIMVNA